MPQQCCAGGELPQGRRCHNPSAEEPIFCDQCRGVCDGIRCYVCHCSGLQQKSILFVIVYPGPVMEVFKWPGSCARRPQAAGRFATDLSACLQACKHPSNEKRIPFRVRGENGAANGSLNDIGSIVRDVLQSSIVLLRASPLSWLTAATAAHGVSSVAGIWNRFSDCRG